MFLTAISDVDIDLFLMPRPILRRAGAFLLFVTLVGIVQGDGDSSPWLGTRFWPSMFLTLVALFNTHDRIDTGLDGISEHAAGGLFGPARYLMCVAVATFGSIMTGTS